MRYENIYFIGIGGIGMSAIARFCKFKGANVSGYDRTPSALTKALESEGIQVHYNDDPSQIPADIQNTLIVYTPAVPNTLAELSIAREKGYNVIKRSKMLGELTHGETCLAVAGTHGKSTTTGILGHVLSLKDQCAYLIGDGHGYMPEKAKHFVLESCEFQRHFLAYHPDYAIITNIDMDHVDYYKDMDDYISAFQSFANQVKKHIVIFGDDPHLTKMHYHVPVTTYGMKDGNDYQAAHIEQGPFGMHFDCVHDGKVLAHVELNEVGDPFLQDALGCFALAHELGMPADLIVEGLKGYKGIARRFVINKVKDSILVDDYAHHPTAIRYMIDAVRKKYPDKKIVALYKPDRYSRLQYFLDDFANSLNTADQVCLLDFPKNAVREDASITVTIQDLMKKCPNSILLDVDDASAKKLKELAPAAFVFMSSKDIYLLRDKLEKIL